MGGFSETYFDPTEMRRRMMLDPNQVFPTGGMGATPGTGFMSQQQQQPIFPTPNQTPEAPVPLPPIPAEAIKPSTAVNAPLPPIGPGTQAYESAAAAVPKMEDFPIGRAHRILAGVLGGIAGLHDPTSGANTAEEVLRGGYHRAMGEYTAKVGALKPAAERETQQREQATKGYEAETARAENTARGYWFTAHGQAVLADINRKTGQEWSPVQGSAVQIDAQGNAFVPMVSKQGEKAIWDLGRKELVQEPKGPKPTEAEREGELGAKTNRTPAEENEYQILKKTREGQASLRSSEVARNLREPTLSPQDLEHAQENAINDVVRSNSKFEQFIDTSGKVPRVKRLGEVLPGRASKFFGFGGNPETIRADYNSFLAAVQARQRTYEGVKKSTGAAGYTRVE